MPLNAAIALMIGANIGKADPIRAHLAQLRKNDRGQALPLDLLRDIKRLNDHLIAGAASCALLASRIRMDRLEILSLEGRR